MISCDPTDFPEIAGDVAGRATLVRAARPIRLECVVRGYLFGHGWSEYQRAGHGRRLRGAGRAAAGRAAARAAVHADDEGRDRVTTCRSPRAEAAELVGADVYEQLRDLSLRLYALGAAARRERAA